MEKAIEAKLEEIAKRFKEIEENLGKPEVVSNPKKFQSLAKEHSELQPIYDAYSNYKRAKKELREAIEIIENSPDEELVELAKEERKRLEKEIEELEEKIKKLLIPKDPNDEKNVILEIRAGA